MIQGGIVAREDISIRGIYSLTPSAIQDYWKDLLEGGNLRYRLSDIRNPTMDDVLRMIRTSGGGMYVITLADSGAIVGEFMLENFRGKSAQLHFSMHPDNSLKENLFYSRQSLKHILTRWKNAEDDTQPFLDSVYGITPVHNRRACIYAIRVGFTKLGIVKSACAYLGHVCDGMVTTIDREATYGL